MGGRYLAFRCPLCWFDKLFVGFATNSALEQMHFNLPESQIHQKQSLATTAPDASRPKRDILDAAPVLLRSLGRHVCEKRGGEAIFFKNRWFLCGWAASIMIW